MREVQRGEREEGNTRLEAAMERKGRIVAVWGVGRDGEDGGRDLYTKWDPAARRTVEKGVDDNHGRSVDVDEHQSDPGVRSFPLKHA